MFGTPKNPDYWRAADDPGFGQLALLLPTRPLDESLRVLDKYAALVNQRAADSVVATRMTIVPGSVVPGWS